MVKDKLPKWLISRRFRILGIFAALTLLCAFGALQVRVNYDMTRYLPDDSAMKQGLDLMNREFPSMGADKSIRVMTDGLDASAEAELLERLRALPHVDSVAHGSGDAYRQGTRSLFVIRTYADYGSPEERSIERALDNDFREYRLLWKNDNAGADGVPFWLFPAAGAILVVILLIMCRSWFEPVLFLANIGMAVVLNAGTNIIFGEISYVTSTMAAVLQLVLSIDYSIMLMNRYRQEKCSGLCPADAMAAALRNCFASIAGSALTTAAGLLALAFMHFKIGLDLGLSLAKGVLLSLLCVLTVLPGLIVMGDRLIERSAKKTFRFSMDRLARFSCRHRVLLSIGFVVLFAVFAILQGTTPVTYTLAKVDPIAETFPPDNPLVIVYENKDEDAMAQLAERVARYDRVMQVISWPGLFGRAFGADELPAALAGFSALDPAAGDGFSMDPAMLQMIYLLRFSDSGLPAGERKMTIPELMDYVQGTLLNDPRFAALVAPEMRDAVNSAKAQLDNGMRMLKSDGWSRMVIYSSLPVESAETKALMDMLSDAGSRLTGRYYMIGNSAMSYEMQHSFTGELWTITLLTAAAIFLIVLLTSRSFIVPALLVLIVQCGVFITVTLIGWQGYQIYFLALLIVECVLMGATIDYGILFTGYYRENRAAMSPAGALKAAYDGSVHSIMTSGLIIVVITGVFGYTYPDPAIAEICRTIATGALSAVLVILLMLPGLLAALDPLLVRNSSARSGRRSAPRS